MGGSRIAHLLWTISWQAGLLAVVVWVVCRTARKAPASWRYALWVVVLVKFFVPPFVEIPGEWAFWRRPRLASIATGLVSRHLDVLLIVWLTGVSALIVLLLVRGRRQAQSVKSSGVADEDLVRVLMDSALGLRGCYLPQIRLFEKAPTPMLVGLIRPTVLIPPGILESCTPTDVRAMLMHELAHIKRRDILVLWLQQLAQVLFFFHPAVWLAGRELGKERELACDEMILNTSSISNQDYASGYFSALKMANSVSRAPMTLGMSEPFEVEKQRLLMIFRSPVPKLSLGWAVALVCIAALGLPTVAGVVENVELRLPAAEVPGVRNPEAASADWTKRAAAYIGVPFSGSGRSDLAELWKERPAKDLRARAEASRRGSGGLGLGRSDAVAAYVEESDPYSGIEGEGVDQTPQTTEDSADISPEPTDETRFPENISFARPLAVRSARRAKGGVYVDGFSVTNGGVSVLSDDFNDADISGWSELRHTVLFPLRRRPPAWCLYMNWTGGGVAEAFHSLPIDDPGVLEVSALFWLPPVKEQCNWKENKITFTNLVLYSGSTEDNIFAGFRLHPGEPGYRVWLGWNNYGGRDGKRWTGRVVLTAGRWAKLTLRLDPVKSTASALLNGKEVIILPYSPDRFASISKASIWGWLGSGGK